MPEQGILVACAGLVCISMYVLPQPASINSADTVLRRKLFVLYVYGSWTVVACDVGKGMYRAFISECTTQDASDFTNACLQKVYTSV